MAALKSHKLCTGKVTPIHDPVLKKKFADGCRKTQFKRTLVEEYAPYVQEDGLIVKITRCKDFECTQPLIIEERYENRQDKLTKIIWDITTDIVTEYFGSGREDAVLSTALKFLSCFFKSFIFNRT